MVNSRVQARLSTKALLNNYRQLLRQVPTQELLPMIKANAYGHGVSWVARQLRGEKRLAGFGVATLQEGVELRQIVGSSFRKPIHIFSGAMPWSDDVGRLCRRHGLLPVLATEGDWRRFIKGGWHVKIPFEIKFDTGMHRLGLDMTSLAEVERFFRKESKARVVGVLSHLAEAESPKSRTGLKQLKNFRLIRKELGFLPQARFHLANSAGIWNAPLWNVDELTDMVRPGLSLYGVSPWEDRQLGLKPVMQLKAQILRVFDLLPGESVGYGSTYRHPLSKRKIRIAVLAAGYGDGVHRSLSSKGVARIGTRRSKFLGRVSMDLLVAEAGPRDRPGQWAELWGRQMSVAEQARLAGTIPYELLTSVSTRVERIYE